MKKIFMVAIASTVLLSVSAQQKAKDTCPCLKSEVVKTTPKSPRQWRQHPVQEAKGLIVGSFNDSIFVEDHTGLSIIPEISGMPGQRLFPPTVSNLKEIRGSFNRYIAVKRFSVPKEYHRYHYWYDDFAWLSFLFFLGLIALVVYLLTRPQQTPSVTVHIPPTPQAPSGHRPTVAPAVDLKDLFERAAKSGATIVVYSDGGFKIIPPVEKEEKPTVVSEVKKEEEK